MKKVKAGVLALLACLLLTACGRTQNSYVITFNSNGGSDVSSLTVSEGEKVAEPTSPTKDGYDFDGWYLNITDEEPYDFTKEVTSDLKLTAKWIEKASGECNKTCESGYELVNCECVKSDTTVTSVKLNKSSLSLVVGKTAKLKATVKPSGATTTWESSNKKVATVSKGKVTAVGEGTATITVTAGGKSAKATVTVTKAKSSTSTTNTTKVTVKSIKLSETSITLVEGNSKNITATISPSNAKDASITWTTSNNDVATVSNGKIVAVSAGSATITATAGDKSAKITVTVISKEQENLSNALASMKAKTLENGNTDINYTYSGCTITNISNTVNNSKTVIENGIVKTLYRSSNSGSITSKYKVVCGSASDTKTLKHTVSASKYTYTTDYNNILYIIKVSGSAKDYTLSSNDVANLKYNASAGGAQTALDVKGTVFAMTFNSDASTIYEVKSES